MSALMFVVVLSFTFVSIGTKILSAPKHLNFVSIYTSSIFRGDAILWNKEFKDTETVYLTIELNRLSINRRTNISSKPALLNACIFLLNLFIAIIIFGVIACIN